MIKNIHMIVYDLFNICHNYSDNKSKTQKTSKLHHKLFIDTLIKHGFIIFNKDYENVKKILKEGIHIDHYIDIISGLYIIEELYGSQKSPDIIIINVRNNKILRILQFELKSGNKKIMWNDGYPNKNTICVYSDTKLNKTILFSNDSLMCIKTRIILEEYLTKIKEMNTEIKQRLHNNPDNFNIYIRKANSQVINILKYSPIDIMIFKKLIYMRMSEFINLPIQTKKGISLFSGAGGDTLGMINAGIDVVGFIEYDDDAIKTHLLNFPESILIGKDIYDIKDEELKKYKDIHIIFGGFPCQSFSHGGKKNNTDPRGYLYKEFVRVTNIIKPKFILGENVKGILTRKNENGSLILDDIIKAFLDIGYTITYKLIKCHQFGIPQKRTRVFLIGVYNNVININIPESNNTYKSIRDICEFSLYNSLKIDKQHFLDIIPDDKVIINTNNNIIEVSGNIPTNLRKCYNEIDNHGISFGKRSKSTFSSIEDIDEQTHTILCTYNRMPRLFIPMKYNNNIYLRPFTINELKQIQGFPIEFKFYGSESSIIKQIGNAVPPIVVTEIIKYLLSDNF